jgi:hypothetical protein
VLDNFATEYRRQEIERQHLPDCQVEAVQQVETARWHSFLRIASQRKGLNVNRIIEPGKKKLVAVHDKMQRNYRYQLVAPIGRDFDPEFTPELTPKQMLALGVFGGKYMTDCAREFPKTWFAKAKLSPEGRNCKHNYFGVNASQPLAVWKKKGWIRPQDPRGWFQWYCRYYMGRRTEDDARQIKRWKAIRRHVAQVKRHCECGDPHCRPRQRQALLHWAYDSRKI